jgi:hypothetical protein
VTTDAATWQVLAGGNLYVAAGATFHVASGGGLTDGGTFTAETGSGVTIDPATFEVLASGHLAVNADASFDVAAGGTLMVDGGVVAGVTVTAGGSGYSAPPTVAFSGSGAAGVATITGGVGSVAVTNGGTNYSAANVLLFGDGTGATATATVSNGVVTAVNVTNPGSGYSSPPFVYFYDPVGFGGGAAGAATIIGAVTGVAITNAGSGYTAPPAVTFSGDGTGAAAIAAINTTSPGVVTDQGTLTVEGTLASTKLSTIVVDEEGQLATTGAGQLNIQGTLPTWNNPADITQGTALSSTQPGATANVAGTFDYTPGPGTVLNAGKSQVLSATFTPDDTTNYSGGSAETLINVVSAGTVPSITSGNSTTFTVGSAGSFTVKASGAPTPALTETGALPSGVTLTDNGDGTATLAGTPASGSSDTYTFTITASNGVSPDATKTFTLTVNPAALVSIAVTPAGPSVAKGLAVQFTATGTFTDGTTQNLTSHVTWASADMSIATISNASVASGVATGTTGITATLSGVTSPSDTLNVTAAVLQSIAVTPATLPNLPKGLTQQFTATGHFSDSSTQDLTTPVTWSASGSAATINSSTGLATGVSVGTSMITASQGTITSSGVTLNVTAAVLQSIAVTPPSPSVAKGFTVQLTAIGTYSDSSTQNLTTSVTWASANTSVATINSAGVATGVAAGTTGITAKLNGVTSPSDTLTVQQAAAITSASSTTFTAGTAGNFTITASGVPAPSLSESNTDALPGGVTFSATTGVLSGTPAAGSGGIYTLHFTAHNGVGSDATQTFTLTINELPTITNAITGYSFTVGSNGSFTVTTGHDYPATTTLTETGTLPAGVSFSDNHNGTATISGNPASNTGGTYTFTVTAQNAVGSATKTFTVTVHQAAAITSANSMTFLVGTSGTFTVAASGFPAPALSESGGSGLPSGVSFTDNKNGTATLAGTPTSGSGGTYSFTIRAHNGVGSDAPQTFTLTVDQAPTITSASSTSFTASVAGSFTVTTAPGAFPTNTHLSKSGNLPSGVKFSDNHDGTATISGTPASGSGGTYTFTITAQNGVGSGTTQTFTLTVNQAPSVTSASSTKFTVGTAGNFTVAVGRFPQPSLSESTTDKLPGGVTFDASTGVLSGTPAAGSGGTYLLHFTATNGSGTATQTFTLTVSEAPKITSAKSTAFTVGTQGTFTIMAIGFPAPALSESGALPAGVTFVDNHDGTATLSGTPKPGSAGTYILQIKAHNSGGGDDTQTFTLTVN